MKIYVCKTRTNEYYGLTDKQLTDFYDKNKRLPNVVFTIDLNDNRIKEQFDLQEQNLGVDEHI